MGFDVLMGWDWVGGRWHGFFLAEYGLELSGDVRRLASLRYYVMMWILDCEVAQRYRILRV
jgi:hypothetical protein